MIIDKFVEIPIYKNSKNKKYYRSKGYIVIDNNTLILNVDDLPISSTFKVKVICDICGLEKYIEYRFYLKNIQKYNYYSCRGKCSENKFKNTNIERYNVDNPLKLEEIKNKIKDTNLKKYGCENVFQNITIKEKIKNSNIKKYGFDNSNKNEDQKKKKRKTSLIKYGTNYPIQNENIFIKNQLSCFLLKKHTETNLYYRGTYEKHFLDFCVINNINIKQGKRILYYFNNNQHYYFSDFFIEELNLIIEIKSDWIYKKDLLKNIAKMEYTLKCGYDFLFLIDKNYNELKNKLML